MNRIFVCAVAVVVLSLSLKALCLFMFSSDFRQIDSLEPAINPLLIATISLSALITLRKHSSCFVQKSLASRHFWQFKVFRVVQCIALSLISMVCIYQGLLQGVWYGGLACSLLFNAFGKLEVSERIFKVIPDVFGQKKDLSIGSIISTSKCTVANSVMEKSVVIVYGGKSRQLAYWYGLKGDLERAKFQDQNALIDYQHSLALYGQHDAPLEKSELLSRIACLHVLSGKNVAAMESLDSAIVLLGRCAPDATYFEIGKRLALVSNALGNYSQERMKEILEVRHSTSLKYIPELGPLQLVAFALLLLGCWAKELLLTSLSISTTKKLERTINSSERLELFCALISVELDRGNISQADLLSREIIAAHLH